MVKIDLPFHKLTTNHLFAKFVSRLRVNRRSKKKHKSKMHDDIEPRRKKSPSSLKLKETIVGRRCGGLTTSPKIYPFHPSLSYSLTEVL